MTKRRLDIELVCRQMAESREQSKRMIMAGEVFVKGRRAEKPSIVVTEEDEIEVRRQQGQYVSRGGLKLEKALRVFSIDIHGMVAADIGASTGGFTDCMLKHGARKVYAVDVGYGQLDYRLRVHPAVSVMERTNARHIRPDMFEEALDYFSMDVSFISVKLILPALYPCIREQAQAVVLIKPQFEAGRELVGKNGVVRDRRVHEEVLHGAIDHARQTGYSIKGLDFSPVKGPEGNIEFLLHLARNGQEKAVDVERVTALAHAQLH